MGFNIADLIGFHLGFLQRLADHPLLRRATGGRKATAAPILVDHRAANHGEDPIAIGLGLGEAL